MYVHAKDSSEAWNSYSCSVLRRSESTMAERELTKEWCAVRIRAGRKRLAKAGKSMSAPGLVRILGDTRGPSPIPGDEIDAVRRVVETAECRGKAATQPAGHRSRYQKGAAASRFGSASSQFGRGGAGPRVRQRAVVGATSDPRRRGASHHGRRVVTRRHSGRRSTALQTNSGDHLTRLGRRTEVRV